MPGRSPSREGRAQRFLGTRDRRSRLGFSLLELLVVVLLISLCAATTVRWYFSHGEVTLENAAILLARDLRAAQHRSLFLNQPSHFRFMPDGGGYVVTDEAGTIAHNPQTEEPFLRIYSEDGVFAGVQVRDARAGDDRTLVIDARGNPKEDLSVTLTFDGEERTLLFEHSSARITIVGSTSGWSENDS